MRDSDVTISTSADYFTNRFSPSWAKPLETLLKVDYLKLPIEIQAPMGLTACNLALAQIWLSDTIRAERFALRLRKSTASLKDAKEPRTSGPSTTTNASCRIALIAFQTPFCREVKHGCGAAGDGAAPHLPSHLPTSLSRMSQMLTGS
jgi:hypothetical protein